MRKPKRTFTQNMMNTPLVNERKRNIEKKKNLTEITKTLDDKLVRKVLL